MFLGDVQQVYNLVPSEIAYQRRAIGLKSLKKPGAAAVEGGECTALINIHTGPNGSHGPEKFSTRVWSTELQQGSERV